jgi:hypothetical protein
MLVVCISVHLKSVLRYKFSILATYHPDTIYIYTTARMWESVVIFRSQKEFASKNVWVTHHLKELQISKINCKFGGMDLFDRGYGPVTRCCEHDSAPLGSETSSHFINSLRGGGAASCVTARWLENGLCLGNFFSSKRGCQSLWTSTENRKRMAVRSGEPELRANSDTGKLSGRKHRPFSLSKPFEREKMPKYLSTRCPPISETTLHL